MQVRPVACKMRPSAAAIPPVSKTRISPGTTLEAGTMQIRPSRRSSVSVDARRFKLSRDLLAFWCWTVPKMAFNKRTEKITRALSGSPVTIDTPAAPIRIMTKRSLNCPKNICHQGISSCSFKIFSPYTSSRFSASSSLSPVLLVLRRFNTSS